METTRPVGIVETAWDQSLRGKRFASSSVLLLLMWVFFQYSQRLVLKSLHRPQFCCHYSSTKTKSAMKGFIILAHGLIVHFLKSLGISGLIYSGFWAQRPYYIRFLGYFDPQGIAGAWGGVPWGCGALSTDPCRHISIHHVRERVSVLFPYPGSKPRNPSILNPQTSKP